ncbi:bifunctional riboflavin kinase/FAD synthetase [Thermosulfuriphilus sp.]
MEIMEGTKGLIRRLRNPVVTIGNFDGVHLGHQALFQETVHRAQRSAGESVAVTFHPHPLKILRPDNPVKLICTWEDKVELIRRAGIDVLIWFRFNQNFAQISAEDFVHRYLVAMLGTKTLVVGYDYAFGKGRQGNIDFLKEAGRKYGFEVVVVPPQKIDDLIASSSKVRELVASGQMATVKKLLGRYYQIRGVVIPGHGRGSRILGIPTANLRISGEELYPKIGVYVVQVIVGERCYGGVMNIGFNPTFANGDLSAEVHIFDFNQNIYGQEIKINLIERLRDEKKFSSPEELAQQIRADIEKARKILAREAGAMASACMEEIKAAAS